MARVWISFVLFHWNLGDLQFPLGDLQFAGNRTRMRKLSAASSPFVAVRDDRTGLGSSECQAFKSLKPIQLLQSKRISLMLGEPRGSEWMTVFSV